MRKRNIIICGLVATIIMLAACTKEDEMNIVSKKVATEQLLPVAGQEVELTFEVNAPWTATTTADWLTIEPTKGTKGTNTITVTTTAINRTKQDRQAAVTVTAGSLHKDFTIRQSGKYAMFNQKEYRIGAEGGQVSMTFKSNIEDTENLVIGYQNLDWASFADGEKTRRDWAGTVTAINVEPNTKKGSRWAMFALALMTGSDSWVELDTATIVQAGTMPGYESTDYSLDGKVTLLQTHLVGHGIPVVLMGDGFTDRDIADSTYHGVMVHTMEQLFTEEPVRSMRDYFDVYTVNAVSRHDAVGEDYETAFSCIPDYNSTHIDANDDKVTAYAEKVNRADSLNMLVVVVVNAHVHNGVTYLYSLRDRAAQYAIAFCPLQDGLEGELFREVLTHEAIGHGLAKLADEYGYDKNGKAGNDEVKAVKQAHDYGWMKNIDTTGDSAKVAWWKFIGDERFATERIGTYEGGYTYTEGIWRPTANSMMNTNESPFNAPSRKLIYDKIRYLGENAKESTLEEFAVFDATHQPEQWDYTTRASHTTKRRLAPPKMIFK